MHMRKASFLILNGIYISAKPAKDIFIVSHYHVIWH